MDVSSTASGGRAGGISSRSGRGGGHSSRSGIRWNRSHLADAIGFVPVAIERERLHAGVLLLAELVGDALDLLVRFITAARSVNCYRGGGGRERNAHARVQPRLTPDANDVPGVVVTKTRWIIRVHLVRSGGGFFRPVNCSGMWV